jgi:thiamine-phosphate pyrophosphorylase
VRGSSEAVDSGRVALARLHIVTDDAVLASPAFAVRARAALEAGGAAVALHLRGHATPGRTLFDLAASLRPVTRETGARLYVNDRVDVALTAGLDGVQIGTRSLPITSVRALAPRLSVGYSAHEGDDIAALGDIDFAFVGPVFATDSHPDHPGMGPSFVGTMSRRSPVPVIAIGGITADRCGAVLTHGAYGVAALGAVWRAPQPGPAVTQLVRAVDEAAAAVAVAKGAALGAGVAGRCA